MELSMALFGLRIGTRARTERGKQRGARRMWVRQGAPASHRRPNSRTCRAENNAITPHRCVPEPKRELYPARTQWSSGAHTTCRNLTQGRPVPWWISSGETDRRRGRKLSHMDVARRVDLRAPGWGERQEGAEEGRAGMPRRGCRICPRNTRHFVTGSCSGQLPWAVWKATLGRDAQPKQAVWRSQDAKRRRRRKNTRTASPEPWAASRGSHHRTQGNRIELVRGKARADLSGPSGLRLEGLSSHPNCSPVALRWRVGALESVMSNLEKAEIRVTSPWCGRQATSSLFSTTDYVCTKPHNWSMQWTA
jgi:hypothetical protein